MSDQIERELLAEVLACRVQRILNILSEGRQSLIVPEVSQWKVLALIRCQLLHALSEFRVFKETHILDPVIKSSDQHKKEAVAIKQRNADLQQLYDSFVRRWEITSQLCIGSTYQKEASAMTGTIEDQVVADVQTLEMYVRSVLPFLLEPDGQIAISLQQKEP